MIFGSVVAGSFVCTDPAFQKPESPKGRQRPEVIALAVHLEIFSGALHRSLPCTNMDRLTKDQLRQEIVNLGEQPPTSLTKMELKCRLLELREVTGLDRMGRKEPSKTPLQEAVMNLNKASKIKSNLTQYVREHFMLEVRPTQTVAQIQKMAMDYLYEHTAVSEHDVVNFGRHANLEYQQLRQEYLQYCEWVRNTARKKKGVQCTAAQVGHVAGAAAGAEHAASATADLSDPRTCSGDLHLGEEGSAGTQNSIQQTDEPGLFF